MDTARRCWQSVGAPGLLHAAVAETASRQDEGDRSYTIVRVYDDADAFTAHRENARFASIGKMQIIPMLESRAVVGQEGDDVIG